MAKRFSELGVTLPEQAKVFNVPVVSITDILNTEIEIIDFLPNVKTKHGEGRCLVHYRDKAGQEGKFFTAATNLKSALEQIGKEDFPFVTIIKAIKCGNAKIYQFT